MDYFDYPIRFEDRDGWLIWCSDKADGVLLDEQKRVLVFSTLEAVDLFAASQGIEVRRSQTRCIDFDSSPGNPVTPLDCDRALRLWNLVEDIERSQGNLKPVKDGANVSAYDKLFHGNNLPAVNQSGKTYVPSFSLEELEEFQNILKRGLRILKTQTTWK